MYYVIFKPSGGLGDALFRYVASSIVCHKFNMKYILLEDFIQLENFEKSNVFTLNDDNYIDFLDSGVGKKDIDKNILMDGNFHFDFILTYFRNEVFEFINKTKHEKHLVKVDCKHGNKKYLINDLMELDLDDSVSSVRYKTVINCDDKFTSYELIENIDKDIIILFDKDCKKIHKWLDVKNVQNIEIENTISDFKLMRKSETLVCSYNTLSWIAAYFSNTISKCYMPNYNNFLSNRNCYFRNPIENTVLYNTPNSNHLNHLNHLNHPNNLNLTVYIITLEKYPERRQKLFKLIESLCKVGLKVEFYNGVDGNEVIIKDTEIDFIKYLEYRNQFYLYNKKVRLNGEDMKKGEIGCALSHILLYKKLILDKVYDKYLILEDDAELDVNIEYLYDTLINIPDNFDLLHISKSDWYPFEKDYNEKDNGKINEIFYKPKHNYFNRTTGYIVSKQGSEKLISYVNGNCINLPSDDLLYNIYSSTYFILYFPERYIFKERNDSNSVIKQVNEKNEINDN